MGGFSFREEQIARAIEESVDSKKPSASPKHGKNVEGGQDVTLVPESGKY